MASIVLVLHVLFAISVVALILLQQGKGADMGAAFGAGASSTVFGATGSANFLSRTTAVLATGFFVTSMVLAILAGEEKDEGSLMERVPVVIETTEEALIVDVPADLPVMPDTVDSAGDVPDTPPVAEPDVPAAPAAATETPPTAE